MTFGAADGIRTRDLLNGNQMLYQLSHSRIWYLHSRRRFSASKPIISFRMVYEPTMESGAG